jgi:hypothetical protein
MSRMAKRAFLKGHLTNHSVRHTMVTDLLHAGVAPSTICQLSGHKNVNSINNYAVASVAQQQDMCAILQHQEIVSNPVALPAMLAQPTQSAQLVAPMQHVKQAPSTVSNIQLSQRSQIASQIQGQVSSLFSGAIFNGPVCFNLGPMMDKFM